MVSYEMASLLRGSTKIERAPVDLGRDEACACGRYRSSIYSFRGSDSTSSSGFARLGARRY